jgi:AhpD family alkylhydroperoxidase
VSGGMRVQPLLADDVDLDAMSRTDRLMTRMAGIFAHRPRLAPAFTAFSATLHREADLPARLRELVRLRIAFHNQCRTCMSIRYASARDDGVTEGLVCSLERPADAADLSERERVALRFADLFANEHLAIDDDVFAELRRHFDDGEIVELAMVCAHYVANGRLMAIMRVTEDLPDAARADGTVAPWEIDETIELA